MLLAMELRLSHRLIDTTGEVNDLQRQVFLLFLRDGFLDNKLGEISFLWLTMLLWHSCRPEWQTHFVHASGNTCHHSWSQGNMSEVCHIKHNTQARLDARHVIGSKLTNLIADSIIVHIHLTDDMRQLTRIDFHRA